MPTFTDNSLNKFVLNILFKKESPITTEIPGRWDIMTSVKFLDVKFLATS